MFIPPLAIFYQKERHGLPKEREKRRAKALLFKKRVERRERIK
jgi:hypothetical protein